VKKLLPVSLIVLAIFGYDRFFGSDVPTGDVRSTDGASVAAYSDWRSGQQVQGEGIVIRLLSDDNDGSRHQRFIVRLNTGQTLLVAHNIDIAPRISSLRKGDMVAFNGEYEWNDKGGLIHWTHRDPKRNHASGWIEHDGRMYQ